MNPTGRRKKLLGPEESERYSKPGRLYHAGGAWSKAVGPAVAAGPTRTEHVGPHGDGLTGRDQGDPDTDAKLNVPTRL